MYRNTTYICIVIQQQTKNKEMKCSICEKDFEGWGNNPEPIKNYDIYGPCCDECNNDYVIPSRILGFIVKK